MNIEHGQRFNVAGLLQRAAIDWAKAKLSEQVVYLLFGRFIITAEKHGSCRILENWIAHHFHARRVECLYNTGPLSKFGDFFRSAGVMAQLQSVERVV